MAALSASSRSKCRPSSWRPASSPSNPGSLPTRSDAATSPRATSTTSPTRCAKCSRIPFYIDQTGGVSIAQLTARARRLKRQRGLDLLVVDYLQLLAGSKIRSENRVQELTEITTGLKALAKELNIPILACSQLSRQVEQRDDKRPQLSDLRESGSIEQDADVVLFVYREEYYLKNREPRPGTEEHIAWMAEMERAHGAGGSHYRQAAPWTDWNDRTSVRRRGDPVRHDRAGRQGPGNPLGSASGSHNKAAIVAVMGAAYQYRRPPLSPGRGLESRMKLITAFGLAAAFLGTACLAAPGER